MRRTRAGGLTRALATLAVATALHATSAAAVEVRQVEGTVHNFSQLVRAYAPCVAPNDVSLYGVPACNPPVTSACLFASGSIDILTRPFGSMIMTVHLDRQSGGPPECDGGFYFLELAFRATADPVEGDLSPCGNGSCTFVDTVESFLLQADDEESNLFVVFVHGSEIADANLEILGATIVAPDGLPMAAIGVGRESDLATSNLSLAYAPCTDPEPGEFSCDTAPVSAACDFESGEIEWHVDTAEVPVVQARLRDVAGSSPLCASGAYQLEATVRATQEICGGGSAPCTLVDRTTSIPIVPSRGQLFVQGGLGSAGLPGPILSAQILSTRVLDPTGEPLAAPAITTTRALTAPQITIKPDQLRIKTVFPPTVLNNEPVDPTENPGVTFTINDRHGVVYAVNIPASRWQLQLPFGRHWSYTDPGGTLGGVRKSRIKMIRKKGVEAGYKIDLLAKDIDLSGAQFPGVNLTIGIPRAASVPIDGVIQAQRNRTCAVRGSKMVCR